MRNHPQRYRLSQLLICCMLGVLAACGGAPAAALPSTVDVRLKSFGIEASAVTLKAGKVTFNATNQATDIPHEMLVVKTDQAPDALPYDPGEGRLPEDKIDSKGEVPELEVGKSGSVTLDLEPGKYLLLCNIATHFKKGMVLPIQVQ
ncbi:MAG: hypothetical protein U0Z44_08420 [Kouleothrix sp.]|nr:hypothetical protein [Kouleothrix sp.]